MDTQTGNPSEEPYWGSVLFFKHVFLSILLLSIIVPIFLAVWFCYKSNRLATALDVATDALAANEVYTAQLESDCSQLLSAADYTEPADAADEPDAAGTDIAYDAPDYCTLYPDLYIEGGITAFDETTDEKVVYLTFDDGPSTLTSQTLGILDEYDIQATFFVVGYELDDPENSALLTQALAEGHSIGVHTESHSYSTIYDSVEDYLADFYTVWMRIYEITGEKVQIFRFPGGSINAYNATIYQEIVAEMTRRGFLYYDWNTSAEDASSSGSVSSIYANATNHRSYNRVFLLLHDDDANKNTLSALPSIIDYYIDEGFSFSAITPSVKPVVFSYTS